MLDLTICDLSWTTLFITRNWEHVYTSGWHRKNPLKTNRFWRNLQIKERWRMGGGLRLKSKNSISLSGKLLVNINLLHSPTSWIYRWRNKCDEMRSNSLRSMYRTFLWINETYLLTPECRVLLEQLTGLQTVKKFPVFHGTRRFITALTSVRHLSLSWASPIQSIYQHPTS